MDKLSKEWEATLPSFSSNKEARAYFVDAFGQDSFVFIGSEAEWFFYDLILDHDEYKAGKGISYVPAYQRVEISMDGDIHVIH